MRRYETIFITDPELPDEQVTGLVDGLSGTIAEHKGSMVKTEDWGRKKLAYEVRKRREGRYLRLEYEAQGGGLTDELERRLRMSETVLKFMTVRMDNDKKRLVWEAKQAVKEKERAARRAAEEAAAAEAEASAPSDPEAEAPQENQPAADSPVEHEEEARPAAGEEG